MALLVVAIFVSFAHAASIPRFSLRTSAYRLEVFSQGHFAVNVAGVWMPGCVCLAADLGQETIPQYDGKRLKQLRTVQRRTDGDTGVIVIEGQVTDALRFTQTLRATDRRLSVAYEVEALRDLHDTSIYITGGPSPAEKLNGLGYRVASDDGVKEGVMGPDTDLRASNVNRVTWSDLADRNVHWVVESASAATVRLTNKNRRYRAYLLRDETMDEGQVRRAHCAVEVAFRGDVRGVRPWSEFTAAPVSFDISGTTGCVHHLRTGSGNIIQHLNLNERSDGTSAYQSQGGEKIDAWGGVVQRQPQKREKHRATVTGPVISDWKETIAARRLDGAAAVDVKWTRDDDAPPTDVRLLLYLAQRLQDRARRFYIRRSDGDIVASAGGQPLRVGMQQRSKEQNLGPYTEIGPFSGGDQLVIPLIHRGEVFTVECSEPAVLSTFRFEHYFRGVWLDFKNNDVSEIKLTMQLRRTHRAAGHDWYAPVTNDGTFSVIHGGIPAIAGVTAFSDSRRQAAIRRWRGEKNWRGTVEAHDEDDAVRAQWERDESGPARIAIALPIEAAGRQLTLHDTDGNVIAATPAWRVGAEAPARNLDPGGAVLLHQTALRTLRIQVPFDAEVSLKPGPASGGVLIVKCQKSTNEMALTVRQIVEDAPPMEFDNSDRRATQSGLRAEYDGDDVVVTSPWWQVRQSAAAGGEPSEILFFYGSGENILTRPVRSYLRADSGESTATADNAELEIVEETGGRVVVRATGALASTNGGPRVPYTAKFEYRTGYLRQTWEYEFGDGVKGITRFAVQRMDVRPSLDEYLARRLERTTIRGNAVFPGPPAFNDRQYARYMCLFDRGVEGIEFLSGRNVGQWRDQLGPAGHARYAIQEGPDGGASIVCEPWSDNRRPIAVSGKKRFQWFMGLPNIRPQLDRQYFVAHASGCGEKIIRSAAYHGFNVLHLGAGVTPGSYTPADPAGTKQIVDIAHRYGMKTYPFDAHALLSKKVDDVSAEQRRQWRTERINKDGDTEPWVYSAYGDYMCEEAEGWRKYMQRGFSSMMDEFGFDGLYYDFVHPILCYNDRHAGAVPHISSDGMLKMCRWTQKAIGDDGVFSGHTGHVPTIACKNYCTIDTVYEEIGDDQVPSVGYWPEQGQFCNIRPKRLVPSFLRNTCLGPGESNDRKARRRDLRAFVARCALTGIFPSPRTEKLLASHPNVHDRDRTPFMGLVDSVKAVDLSALEFANWRKQTAVTGDNAHLRAATYFDRDRAVVMIANSESDRRQRGTVWIDATQLRWPQNCEIAVATLPKGDCRISTAAALCNDGLQLDMAGYDYRSLLLAQLSGPATVAFCTYPATVKDSEDGRTIVTEGPPKQPGRMVLYCHEPPDVSVNGEAVAAAEIGRRRGRWLPLSIDYEYRQQGPVRVDLSW